MTAKAHLVLADGTRFSGTAFGASESAVGEVVFTTGMTGYEEVLTDPSYCGQIVTMTAPQIGNTGINLEDGEAKRPALRGFVVRELSPIASNWRTVESLDAYLKKNGIIGLAGIDTRALTRHIRDQGAQMAAVGTEDVATLHDRAKAAPPMSPPMSGPTRQAVQPMSAAVPVPESACTTRGAIAIAGLSPTPRWPKPKLSDAMSRPTSAGVARLCTRPDSTPWPTARQ